MLSAACSRVAPWAALVLGSAGLLPILLLVGSNLFMTLAWYWHLRFKQVPLAGVIVTSWLIAFVEYCLAVPANRWGSAVYSSAQLKTIQEVTQHAPARRRRRQVRRSRHLRGWEVR